MKKSKSCRKYEEGTGFGMGGDAGVPRMSKAASRKPNIILDQPEDDECIK
jgi:hypothetical protein